MNKKNIVNRKISEEQITVGSGFELGKKNPKLSVVLVKALCNFD